MKIELTSEQIGLLQFYIILTKSYRKEAREDWEELAKLTKDDGTPEIPSAKDNAQWFAELGPRLDEIMTALGRAR